MAKVNKKQQVGCGLASLVRGAQLSPKQAQRMLARYPGLFARMKGQLDLLGIESFWTPASDRFHPGGAKAYVMQFPGGAVEIPAESASPTADVVMQLTGDAGAAAAAEPVDPAVYDPESGLRWEFAEPSAGSMNASGLQRRKEADLFHYLNELEGTLKGEGVRSEARCILDASSRFFYVVQFASWSEAGQHVDLRALTLFQSRDMHTIEEVAYALGFAFLQRLDKVPHVIETLKNQCMTYPNAVVRLKTMIAILHSGHRETIEWLRTQWATIDPMIQDRCMTMLLNRFHSNADAAWVWIMREYIRHVMAPQSTNDPAVVSAVTHRLELMRFQGLLGSLPAAVIAGAKENYLLGMQEHNAVGRTTRFSVPASTADVDHHSVMGSVIATVRTALYVVAQHPELQATEIYQAASAVIASNIAAIASPGEGLIDEVRSREAALEIIRVSDLEAVLPALLEHDDLTVRLYAAQILIGRSTNATIRARVVATLQTLMRDPSFLPGLDTDARQALSKIAPWIQDAGLFDDPEITANLLRPLRERQRDVPGFRTIVAQVIQYVPAPELIEAIQSFGLEALYDAYASGADGSTYVVCSALERLSHELEPRNARLQTLLTPLLRSANRGLQSVATRTLAFNGVYNAPGQLAAARAELNGVMSLLDAKYHRALLMGKRSVDRLKPLQVMAMLAAHRSMFRLDHWLRVLKGSQQRDHRRFARVLMIYAEVAVVNGTGPMDHTWFGSDDPDIQRLVGGVRKLNSKLYGGYEKFDYYKARSAAMTAYEHGDDA